MTKSGQELSKLFDGAKAFRHLEFMQALGPRVPGSFAHRELERYMEELGQRTSALFHRQEYSFHFMGQERTFRNLIYILEGHGANKKRILLGTHYDSRMIADNEPDPVLRNRAIAGINDGGSGTAVLLELLGIVDKHPQEDDVCIAFFDAEDVGNIEGHGFSEGAESFAAGFKDFVPDEVVVIDMIGGIDAKYQVDYGCLGNRNSRELLDKIWRIGRAAGFPQFAGNDRFEGSFFICDNTPFARRGIPAMVLIDITYEWWHTHGDTIEHCSAASLEAAGKVLIEYLYGG